MTDDFVPNDKIEVPDQVHDFGTLLRHYRLNHGYTIQQVAKMVGLPVQTISAIELSKQDLPPENQLRMWLGKLGCGRSVNKIILLSRNYRVKHWITLNRNETSNPHLLRLIEAYRSNSLTDYDRALLQLIAR